MFVVSRVVVVSRVRVVFRGLVVSRVRSVPRIGRVRFMGLVRRMPLMTSVLGGPDPVPCRRVIVTVGAWRTAVVSHRHIAQ